MLFLALILYANAEAQEWVPTQAKITALETRISGRKMVTRAQIKYEAPSGDSLSSQIRLMDLPFFGLSKEVGDVIPVVYQKDNLYMVKSQEDSFLQTYGLYILIGLGVIFSGYQLIKKMKLK